MKKKEEFNDQQLRELMDAAEIASIEDAAEENRKRKTRDDDDNDDDGVDEAGTIPPPLPNVINVEDGMYFAPIPKKMKPGPPFITHPPPMPQPLLSYTIDTPPKKEKATPKRKYRRRKKGDSDSDYEDDTISTGGNIDDDDDDEDYVQLTPKKRGRGRKAQTKAQAAEKKALDDIKALDMLFDERKLLEISKEYEASNGPGKTNTNTNNDDDDDDDDDDNDDIYEEEDDGDNNIVVNANSNEEEDDDETYGDDRLECENAMELGESAKDEIKRGSEKIKRGRRRRRFGRGGRGRNLNRAKGMNEEQSKMMGQANLLFTNGKFSEAAKILLELVKQAPKAPDPYNTLGLIHEEIHQHHKALKFYKIAALFNPKKPHRWKSLAQMALGLNEYEDADYCLGKAISGLPDDPEPLMERAKLNVFLVENESFTEKEKMDRHLKIIGYLKALIKLLETKIAGSRVAGVTPSTSPLPESIIGSQKKSQQQQQQQKQQSQSLSQSQQQQQKQSEQQQQQQQQQSTSATQGEAAVVKERVSPETARQREEMLREAQIMISKEYYAIGSLKEAVSVLQELYDKQVRALRAASDIYRPEDYDMTRIFELINMLSELYLELGDFEKTITLITTTKAGLREGETLPLELVVNYGICKAYLGDMNEALSALGQLFNESVEDYGDLFYNVAEAFLAIGEFAHARSVFAILCRHASWDIPSIWLKIAQTHRSEGNLTEAARLFERVLAAVPINVYSVVALYEIYQSTGEKARACLVLENFLSTCGTSKDPDSIISRKELVKIIESKIKLLFELKRMEEFVNESLKLISDCKSGLFDSCIPQRRRGKRAHQQASSTGLTASSSSAAVSSFIPDDPEASKAVESKEIEGEEAEEEAEEEEEDGKEEEQLPALLPLLRILEPPKFFEFILRICSVLSGLGRNAEAAGIAEAGNECSRMCRPESTEDIMRLKKFTVEIFYRLGQYQVAFDKIRPLCIAEPENPVLWNLLDEILIKSKMYYRDKPQKVLVRLLQKHPNNFALIMLVAHHCLVSGHHSVEEYTNALCVNPDDPLANLCLGISLVLKSASRRVADKNYSIIKGFAFLYKYARIRGQQSQEVLYNLARAYQQLGIAHIAEKLYLEVLKPSVADQQAQDPEENLKMEAAYNLAYLYKQSGSHALAKSVTETYCSI